VVSPLPPSCQRGVLGLATVLERCVNTTATPITINVLKILLPKMFPTAISGLPARAAMMETHSSGTEVANATIVSPTTIGGIDSLSDTP